MKKILILALSFIFGINTYSFAQGTSTVDLFKQNPAIQASIIAANDDRIEERIDPTTGDIYFVRQVENPWNGAIAYVLVEFVEESAQFVDVEYYTRNGEEDTDNHKEPQKPCPIQQDSCKKHQPHILKNKQKTRPEPHRSSRVKLADNF